jgi:hypothetical protein
MTSGAEGRGFRKMTARKQRLGIQNDVQQFAMVYFEGFGKSLQKVYDTMKP